MKITRHKRHLVLRMTEGEFEALQALVSHGQADMEGTTVEDAFPGLSQAARRAMLGRFADQNPLRVDHDKREAERHGNGD